MIMIVVMMMVVVIVVMLKMIVVILVMVVVVVIVVMVAVMMVVVVVMLGGGGNFGGDGGSNGDSIVIVLAMVIVVAVVVTVDMVMLLVLVVVMVVVAAVLCPYFVVTGAGKRIIEARLSVCWVTEVVRTLYLSLFGIRTAGQGSPALWLETVEYLKIEFYEPPGPFQKYIYMDGGPVKVFLLAPWPPPAGCASTCSGFPTPWGCSQLQKAVGTSGQLPARLGVAPSPWPCTGHFGTDSFLLRTRSQPLQSPPSTSKANQPLYLDFTVPQPGPTWTQGHLETEGSHLIANLAG